MNFWKKIIYNINKKLSDYKGRQSVIIFRGNFINEMQIMNSYFYLDMDYELEKYINKNNEEFDINQIMYLFKITKKKKK